LSLSLSLPPPPHTFFRPMPSPVSSTGRRSPTGTAAVLGAISMGVFADGAMWMLHALLQQAVEGKALEENISVTLPPNILLSANLDIVRFGMYRGAFTGVRRPVPSRPHPNPAF
uniref:Uncharacterized protein n=1 Tax=Oryza glaberrima TaxID=4538 RepID=I1PYA1_ORYGL